MAGNWAKWERLVINGDFPLRRFLSRSNHSVVFLTRFKELDAVIKLIPAHPTRAEAQLSHWRMVAGLSHPHLIRIFDTGSCQIAGHPFLFIVMDHAEQTLAQILAHRPLTPDEVREMLLPTLDALAFIHGKNLVHRKLKPTNILAVNDQLKLATDTVRPSGDSRAGGAKFTVYDPPEARDGVAAAAGDIWALGVTLAEALTQHPPAWPDRGADPLPLAAALPAEFLDTVRRCLSHEPADRPTIADLKAQFDPQAPIMIASPAPAMIAAASQPAAAPQPAEQEAKQQSAPAVESPKWRLPLPAVGGAAALIAAIWAGSRLIHTHAPSQPPASPASAVSEPLPAAPAPILAAPILPAPTPTAAPPSVLHQEIPVLSRNVRASIRGHIKVAVLVTVDRPGNVVATTMKHAGSSLYFARLASEAALKWRFAPAANPALRQWLVHFEFTRRGASGHADAAASLR